MIPFRDQVEPAAWALFCGLRSAPTPAEADLLSGLGREAWRRVGELALRTFSASLLYAQLRASGLLASAPDDVQTRLGRMYAWNLTRNQEVLAQLREIAGALRARGVAPMILKGAHLARCYPQLAARSMGDIDLLVRREDLDTTRSAMQGLGYGPEDRPPVEAEVLLHHHLPPFTRPGGLPVEVHWSLNEGPVLAPWQDAVWDRAVPLDGGEELGMEPLDALLFACRHLAVHHGFSTTNGLAGLTDVALLVERNASVGGFDPGEVAARARAWGIVPGVFLCLLLARDLLGAPVATPVLDALEVPGWETPAASALWTLLHVGGLGLTRDLLLETRASLNPPPPASAILGHDRVAAALGYLRQATLPPVDDMALEFRRLRRKPLCYLAYPLHWTRLVYSHAGLLRLARPAVRDAYRRRFYDQQQVIADFVGSARISHPT